MTRFIARIMAKFGYMHMDAVSEKVAEHGVACFNKGFDNGYSSGYNNGHYAGYEAALGEADAKAHREEMEAWSELLIALDN